MRVAAAIIAGGRSSRMGGAEKSFAVIGGKRILDLITERLAPQADEIVINANGDISRFATTGLTVVADVLTDVGTPLSGLHASLAWASRAGFDLLLTTPSDCPFIPLDLVQRLRGREAAAIAASGGQPHYLTGLWPASLLPALEAAIRHEGLFRVKDWVSHAGAAAIEWPVSPYDPFFNVNTPEELAEAERIAAQFAP